MYSKRCKLRLDIHEEHLFCCRTSADALDLLDIFHITMKITVLTIKKSLFGLKFLNLLNNEYGQPNAIIFLDQPIRYYYQLFRFVNKRVGLFETLYFSSKRIMKYQKTYHELKKLKNFCWNYNRLSKKTYHVHGDKERDIIKALKNCVPDLLVLAETGIVSPHVFEIPRLGTLNGHPGILPYYRGIDSWKWAIFNDEIDKIGSTVHWVDEKVDHGSILMKESLHPDLIRDPNQMDTILHNQCFNLLIKTIRLLDSHPHIKGTEQDDTVGKQYFKMPLRLERITHRKVKNFQKQ